MAGVVAALAMAYGWFEAGWLRTRVLEVAVAGLPEELDGLRIAHLSDFHLGLLTPKGSHHSDRSLTGRLHSVHWLGKASHGATESRAPPD